MTEYISKEDILSYLPQYPLDYSHEEMQAFLRGFTQLRDHVADCKPTYFVGKKHVTTAQRKRGYWAYVDDCMTICSECNSLGCGSPYCPSCGARMDGEDDV